MKQLVLASIVLAALAAEIAESDTKTDKAKKLLARLSKRIDWSKAIKLAATTRNYASRSRRWGRVRGLRGS